MQKNTENQIPSITSLDYEIKVISRFGNRDNWHIVSKEVLNDKQIVEIINKTYPNFLSRYTPPALIGEEYIVSVWSLNWLANP